MSRNLIKLDVGGGCISLQFEERKPGEALKFNLFLWRLFKHTVIVAGTPTHSTPLHTNHQEPLYELPHLNPTVLTSLLICFLLRRPDAYRIVGKLVECIVDVEELQTRGWGIGKVQIAFIVVVVSVSLTN